MAMSNALRRWMTLCEAMAPPDNSQFKTWFAGSKVVDKQGNPLPCFHGTFADVQRPWEPLTHFGTSTAAWQRIDPGNEEIDKARLYPVYLRIRNPIRVVDDADEDNGDQLIWVALQKLVRRKIVKQEEYEDVLSQWRGKEEHAHQLMAMELIAQHGFDGLCYRNQVEHRGSTSWVIFGDEQVWPAFSTNQV